MEKTDYSEETKKDSKKIYCTNIRSSRRQVLSKKGVTPCLTVYF